jgi:hypothetical protein
MITEIIIGIVVLSSIIIVIKKMKEMETKKSIKKIKVADTKKSIIKIKEEDKSVIKIKEEDKIIEEHKIKEEDKIIEEHKIKEEDKSIEEPKIKEEDKIIEEPKIKEEDKSIEEQDTNDAKGFLEIENKSRRLVEIEEIQLDDDGVDTVYLLTVAGIDIRLFFSYIDANRNCIFMKNVVKEVILNGHSKVEVKELKTDDKTYFMLQMAGRNTKIYTSLEEATRVANYMTIVIDAIMKMI